MLLTLDVVRHWKQLLICASAIIYLHTTGSVRYATVIGVSLKELNSSSHPKYLDQDWKEADAFTGTPVQGWF